MITRNHRQASDVIVRHSTLEDAIKADFGDYDRYSLKIFDNFDVDYNLSVYADFGSVAYRVDDCDPNWSDPLWFVQTTEGTYRGTGAKEGSDLEDAYNQGYINPV